MTLRRTRTVFATILVAPVLALAIAAAPASAMHSSPAPVDDPAPVWSGHYDAPDTGEKGEARPWEAGPVWNR
jgi:Spy/CpxP family protein refolding chaperone